MKNFWISTLLLFLTGLNGYGQVTKNLKLVWNDEFNGTTIDATKWKVPPEHWLRQGGSYWSSANNKMTGTGQLKLSVTERNGKVYCGALRTHNLFDKKYGYFEVRCKVPQMKGGWAAFWMMPYGNKPGNAGNDGTEIDIFESINGWKGQINHALHWDGYGAEHKHVSEKMHRPDLYDDNYHLFGVMWTPKEYIFYIDNKETWRTSTAGVSDVKQYLKLTLEVSKDNWPGNWDDQKIKPIHWLIDYVRVYDYQPVSEENVSLAFTSLNNNETFNVGDQIQMHTNVSGTLSQLDEIKFFTKKGNEPYVLRKTSTINSQRTYWYNWSANAPGNYKFKVEGYKNGSFVTNITSNASVKSNLAPLSLSFKTLKSGSEYKKGDLINMDVLLSGELSDADQIQFLTKKDDGAFVVQKTQNLTGSSEYKYSYTASQAGNYSFRITALKNGQYVNHVVAGGIIVEEIVNPLSIHSTSLISEDNYKVGDQINLSVELAGNLSDANAIQFLVKKDNGAYEVKKTQHIIGLSGYSYNWTPAEVGNYSLKATAIINGQNVSDVVIGSVTVEEALAPLDLHFSSLKSGNNYKIGDKVNMGVELTGNLDDADEIQYLIRKGNGLFSIQKTETLTGLSAYDYEWIPTQSGEYSCRITALKNGQYVTHVVAGGIIVEEPIIPLSMSFTSIKSGDTYKASTQIPVNIKLSGDLSDADEVQFLVREENDNWSVKHTATVNGTSDYSYNWIPSESGTYSLRVTAKKNGSYVTHTVIGGVEIESNLNLEYTLLEDGAKFNVGNKVKMNVKLVGDYSKIDQLKFVVQKSGETGTVVKTAKIKANQASYGYRWTAKTGNYTLKVAAFSKGVIITNVKANVTVENPPKLTFRFLKNGQSYNVGNRVRMHIRASGNMSKADQIKFVVQKNGGTNQVVKSYNVNPSKKAYNKTWIPKEAGNYKLKAEAYKDGVFVTITVANIKVTSKKAQFRSMVAEEKEDKSLQIAEVTTYPNPSNGIVTINLGSLADVSIKVSNLNGQLVYQQTGLSGMHQFELLGDPGLYFIEVNSEDNRKVFKLIKK